MLPQNGGMDNGERWARPNRPRELVALIQRRSLAFVPVFGAVAATAGFSAAGLARPGTLDPIPLIYIVGFAAMFVLLRWHRRHYGVVRPSEAQRVRGVLSGVAIVAALLAMLVVGPRAVPSPMPFTFAILFAMPLLWEPWRVSLHWLVMVGVLLWLSVVHVFGPAWLNAPWSSSLFVGAAGALCSTIDHMLMVRVIRQAPDYPVMAVRHV
jgi:hypothetical protein